MSFDLCAAPLNEWIAEFVTPPVTHAMLASYAEASGDLNPLHLDPAFARKAGFDDVIVHGMYGMAQLGRLLTANFPADRIRNFQARFMAPIPVGSSIRCRARLVAREASSATLELEASIHPPGAPASVMAISGAASIALNRDA